MSEAVETKKKKSKLPMIIMLIVVLAGGGFFATKGKGDKKEPEVKLGAIEPLGEFLVNLSDGRTYLRTEISVQVADGKSAGAGGGGHGAGADFTVARDAVITILKSKSLRQVSTPEGMDALRREIALAINRAMPKDEEHADEKKSDKKKNKSDKDEAPELLEDLPPDERDHPDWDSETGPVLKVFFTNFATQ